MAGTTRESVSTNRLKISLAVRSLAYESSQCFRTRELASIHRWRNSGAVFLSPPVRAFKLRMRTSRSDDDAGVTPCCILARVKATPPYRIDPSFTTALYLANRSLSITRSSPCRFHRDGLDLFRASIVCSGHWAGESSSLRLSVSDGGKAMATEQSRAA